MKGWVEGGGKVREVEKPPQEVISYPQMVLTTQLGRRTSISFLSRVEFQADNTQLVHSTGANVSVMFLQGCKFSPPEKQIN